VDWLSPALWFLTMEKRKTAATPRFGVYLSQDEAKWLNETRGKFLLKYGLDITATGIIRAGIGQLRELKETELLKLLERHRGRRRGAP
jgi:hypothetical protein